MSTLSSNNIFIFVLGAVLLHIGRLITRYVLIRMCAFKDDTAGSKFTANKIYSWFEHLYILVNIGYSVLVPPLLYRNDSNINTIVVIAIFNLILGSVPSAIVANKLGAYFKITDKELKWNFSKGTHPRDTQIIEIDKLSGIEITSRSICIKLVDHSKMCIKKSDIELLKGHRQLIRHILAIPKRNV